MLCSPATPRRCQAAVRGTLHCMANENPCCYLQASVVADLVQGLLDSGAGVLPDDIGVMATYRKQVGCCSNMWDGTRARWMCEAGVGLG